MNYCVYAWDIEQDKFILLGIFTDEERANDYRTYLVHNGPGIVQEDLSQIKTFEAGVVPPLSYNWNWTEPKEDVKLSNYFYRKYGIG